MLDKSWIKEPVAQPILCSFFLMQNKYFRKSQSQIKLVQNPHTHSRLIYTRAHYFADTQDNTHSHTKVSVLYPCLYHQPALLALRFFCLLALHPNESVFCNDQFRLYEDGLWACGRSGNLVYSRLSKYWPAPLTTWWM